MDPHLLHLTRMICIVTSSLSVLVKFLFWLNPHRQKKLNRPLISYFLRNYSHVEKMDSLREEVRVFMVMNNLTNWSFWLSLVLYAASVIMDNDLNFI